MLNYLVKGIGDHLIIFIHGNSQSALSWQYLFNSAILNEKYKLLALDLPGHGDSYRSLQPEKDYYLKQMSRKALELIHSFSDKPYILIGNSLGSNIIGEIALELNNCKGILLTGCCALGKSLTLQDVFLPNPYSEVNFAPYSSDSKIDALINETVCNASAKDKLFIKEQYLKADPMVRQCFSKTIEQEDYSDELKNLEDSKIPLAVIFGKNEKLCNIYYLDSLKLSIWRNNPVIIENSGHFSHIDNPLKLAEIIGDFAEYSFR